MVVDTFGRALGGRPRRTGAFERSGAVSGSKPGAVEPSFSFPHADRRVSGSLNSIRMTSVTTENRVARVAPPAEYLPRRPWASGGDAEHWTYPRPGSEVEYVIGKTLSTRGER